MKELLSRLPIIGNLIPDENDWHNPKYALKVIKEKELKKIKKKVIKELKKEQIINPKTLFYLHKYIDSSFNKKALNIEGRYIDKQNKLDYLYALGKSEVYALVSQYYDAVNEVTEAEERLRKTIIELDPKTTGKINDTVIFEDDKDFYEQLRSLPEKLEWGEQ